MNILFFSRVYPNYGGVEVVTTVLANRFIKDGHCLLYTSKAIIQRLDVKKFGLNATSRIQAFVFRFISVPAKWIRTSRRYVLNIYTCSNAYADVFQTDVG